MTPDRAALIARIDELIAEPGSDTWEDLADPAYAAAVLDDVDVRNTLLRECRAALVQDQWQPIETAPKDGTRILLAGGLVNGQRMIVVGRMGLQSRAWHTVPGKYGVHPTHWMPVPSPPERRKE